MITLLAYSEQSLNWTEKVAARMASLNVVAHRENQAVQPFSQELEALKKVDKWLRIRNRINTMTLRDQCRSVQLNPALAYCRDSAACDDLTCVTAPFVHVAGSVESISFGIFARLN